MIGLACSTVSCDGFDDNKFFRSFQVMPKVGYKFIEFNCWHPGDLTPSNIRRLKQTSAEVGITPISVYGCGFSGKDIGDRTRDTAHKIRMIEAACELGCRRVVATAFHRGQLGGLDAVIATLKDIIPFAEEKGVLICLENHANNNLETLEDYDKVFNSVPSPNLGLCVDTGHFEAANIKLSDVVKHFPNKINHIHVKETIKFGVEEFVRFGEGVTDNNAFIESILDIGYSGYISVELAISDKSNLIGDLKVPFNLFNKYETF
ncbi:MAG TPA: sugar phosphate isomerase/epimerase family protein [Ruminiclostridium sp.]